MKDITNIPNWTLENIQTIKFDFHTSTCFEANFCIDGQVIAQVENHGRGGENLVYFPKSSNNVYRVAIEALNDEIIKAVENSLK